MPGSRSRAIQRYRENLMRSYGMSSMGTPESGSDAAELMWERRCRKQYGTYTIRHDIYDKTFIILDVHEKRCLPSDIGMPERFNKYWDSERIAHDLPVRIQKHVIKCLKKRVRNGTNGEQGVLSSLWKLFAR